MTAPVSANRHPRGSPRKSNRYIPRRQRTTERAPKRDSPSFAYKSTNSSPVTTSRSPPQGASSPQQTMYKQNWRRSPPLRRRRHPRRVLHPRSQTTNTRDDKGKDKHDNEDDGDD